MYTQDKDDENYDGLGWLLGQSTVQGTFTSGVMPPVLLPFSGLPPGIGESENNDESESVQQKPT